MNYEQKHQEDLDAAKDWFTIAKKDNNTMAIQILENLFPELSESEDDRIRKAIFKALSKKDARDVLLANGIQVSDALAWLEKQGKKKPTDKVEPKFKVGDWVVYNRNDSSKDILYVYDIRNDRYYFNDNIHFSWYVKECDEKCHFWTIQDAKDGDVLAIGNEYFLFKEKKENTSPEVYISHCFTDFVGAFRVTNGRDRGEFLSNEYGVNVCPATKEQREFLFSKMKEAGYEWNAEKKELKKIEQKPTEWSLPYEKNETADKLIALAECLEMDGDCLFNGLSGNDYGKFLRALAIELTQPKQEWSEEDEKMKSLIISTLTSMGTLNLEMYHHMNLDEVKNWLKSIKDRVQPQPKQEWSDEDLNKLANYLHNNGHIIFSNAKQKAYEISLLLRKQNCWKPNKEQMDTLKYACGGNYVDLGILESLYNDLKKL